MNSAVLSPTPVGWLQVPEISRRQAEIAKAVEELRALRRSIAARGEALSWEELKAFRDEGRR